MRISDIPAAIASELSIRPQQVESVITLLDDGNTIPFIARYRKEATGCGRMESSPAIAAGMSEIRMESNLSSCCQRPSL